MSFPRDTHERCGLVRVVNGKEWVCIAAAHDDTGDRMKKNPGHGARSMQWWHGYPPKSERHWFVRRWSSMHDLHPTH